MKRIPSPLALPFAFPGIAKVGCVFSTRIGGNSADPFDRANISYDVGDDPERVRANRFSLKNDLGFEHWNELHQVHGTKMVFDPAPGSMEPGELESGDGLASSAQGQALIVKTADCQPVMLAHASGDYVAGLHVGWRGNTAGFPTSGARAFCERYGLDPKEVMAVRGPSLGPAASRFTNYQTEFGPDFEDYYDPGGRTVDLWRLTRDQLIAAGIPENNIFSLDFCTLSLPEVFFSYRRSTRTGRQAAMIWIR